MPLNSDKHLVATRQHKLTALRQYSDYKGEQTAHMLTSSTLSSDIAQLYNGVCNIINQRGAGFAEYAMCLQLRMFAINPMRGKNSYRFGSEPRRSYFEKKYILLFSHSS